MNTFKNYIFSDISFIDLTLYQFGYEKCKPYHSFGPYKRNHYLFHYVLSGKGTFLAKNDYHIGAGEGFLICPDLVTSYCADGKDPWEYMWIEFDGIKGKEYLEEAGLTAQTPIYIPDIKYKENNIDNPVRTHMKYIIDNPNESNASLIGHLYLFLDALIETSINKKNVIKEKNSKDFYVKEAISFITNNYNSNITVENVAKWCNLNRSYFSTIFKEKMQCTPQEFIMQYRLSKACELLKNTSKSIAEIATMVGYSNQPNFSRAFKNYYGLSPQECRTKTNLFRPKKSHNCIDI